MEAGRERENNEIKFLTQLMRGRGKAKCSKTRGENSMGFKVQTNSEQIAFPLEKYSNNWYFTQLATVYKSWKGNKTLIRGGERM